MTATTPPQVTINLYSDHLALQRPVGCSDIYQQYQTPEGKKRLRAAENLAHMPQDIRVELQDKMQECTNISNMPKHVDMTTGYNSKRGGVYAIYNAVTKHTFKGYVYNLSNGDTALFPLICGNFEMIYGKNKKTDVFLIPAPSIHKQTEVTFDVPAVETPIVANGEVSNIGSASVYNAPVYPANNNNRFPVIPVAGIGGFLYAVSHTGGNNNNNNNNTEIIPPCTAGSNSIGICRR